MVILKKRGIIICVFSALLGIAIVPVNLFFAMLSLVLLMVLGGCTSNESAPLKLVNAMMSFDYETMNVGEFNTNIEKLCDDAGATVPGVYADVTEEFTLAGDDHGPPRYNDAKLEDFMTDTLLYSSIEIHAAHADQIAAHSNTMMYITVPGMTAKETAAILEGDAEEATRFTKDNAAVLNIYPLLIYNVEWDIHNVDAITVAERDRRINDIHSEIKEYWLGMSLEETASEALENDIAAEFARISKAYSDETMMLDCVILSIEFDIAHRVDADSDGEGESAGEPAYKVLLVTRRNELQKISSLQCFLVFVQEKHRQFPAWRPFSAVQRKDACCGHGGSPPPAD